MHHPDWIQEQDVRYLLGLALRICGPSVANRLDEMVAGGEGLDAQAIMLMHRITDKLRHHI